jgi:tRNA-uridine 2-sulfurtransferase
MSVSRQRIMVAMSGGVDSATTAWMLHRAGHELVGIFIKNGVMGGGSASKSCCSASDAADARHVAVKLGIPFHVVDATVPFRSIISGFVADYRAGRTPNPCVRCNAEVKFGQLLELADRVGAARVATGHYARVATVAGRHVLRKSFDSAKDQSYVLSTLSQDQLARAEFPLGGVRKDEVRRLAREAGLPVADKPESQEICFVPSGDYRDLVNEGGSVADESGPIVDVEGRVVGRHDGVSSFTVGQRKGLGIATGEPLYVVAIDAATRTVQVGSRDAARFAGFVASGANWIARLEPNADERVAVTARIRHRHPGAAGFARALPGGRFRVDFETPEFAVTPGQTAVLYIGDDVLAAGTIDEAWREDDSDVAEVP